MSASNHGIRRVKNGCLIVDAGRHLSLHTEVSILEREHLLLHLVLSRTMYCFCRCCATRAACSAAIAKT